MFSIARSDETLEVLPNKMLASRQRDEKQRKVRRAGVCLSAVTYLGSLRCEYATAIQGG